MQSKKRWNQSKLSNEYSSETNGNSVGAGTSEGYRRRPIHKEMRTRYYLWLVLSLSPSMPFPSSETAMGCSVNAQIDTSNPYVRSTARLTKIVFLHQRMPWMWIDAIWKITGYDREYKENLKVLHDFTLQVFPFYI